MSDQTNQAINLVNVESLITNYNSRHEALTKDMKETKEMLNGLLENDDEYQTIAEEAKKITKQKTVAKQKVFAQPNAKELVEKLKDYQGQLKEIKTALSDYLTQYVSLSGSNKIEGPDGELLEIIYSAHLAKTKNA
ncbi:MAG TPA: hypothetical protein VF810_04525 [Patescibacteria group bacterium]